MLRKVRRDEESDTTPMHEEKGNENKKRKMVATFCLCGFVAKTLYLRQIILQWQKQKKR